MIKRKGFVVSVLAMFVVAAAVFGYIWKSNATNADLDERWAAHAPSNTQVVDHDVWQTLLDDYLVTDTDVDVNLFDYAGLIDDGRKPLDDYIKTLVQQDPLKLNRSVQKAYWINLYNAATVQLIINNYPLTSITTLGSNAIEFGPWNDNAVTVNDVDLSLNDIEHRIIRPLYNDYRIHFAVNCASIGCPDLAEKVFTGSELDQQLDAAAAKYLNHPRGLKLNGATLNLSTLFEWYASDFGTNQSEVLATLGKHTSDATSAALAGFTGSPKYDYDWSLNGYCSVDDECGE